MSQIIELAFRTLYPEKRYLYECSIHYSGKFKPYGANVRKIGKHIEFHLCHKWRLVDEGIVVGLLQELLVKLFNEPKDSINIDLYNHFVKNLHYAIPKTKIHPLLDQSFQRVNERYFDHLLLKPNLVLGGPSYAKLGSYDFKADTITISSLFVEHPEVMDYIMYHELLHKDLKFENTMGRNKHHTREFRRRESLFENAKELEQRIKLIVRAGRRSKPRSFFQSLLRGF